MENFEMPAGPASMRSIAKIRENSRPGLIDALVTAEISGRHPEDLEILGIVALLIGGGFDTTMALTAHSLEWLSEHPDERARLSRERGTLLDSATEEFLRFYTPAVGDGRTVSTDCAVNGTVFKEGDRLWPSWAMANRDENVFTDPHTVHLDRTGNRHSSSASASTAASARMWRGPHSRPCSPRCSTGCPTSSATRRARCAMTRSASSTA